MDATTMAVDLAKDVFEVAWANRMGRIFDRTLMSPAVSIQCPLAPGKGIGLGRSHSLAPAREYIAPIGVSVAGYLALRWCETACLTSGPEFLEVDLAQGRQGP